MADNLGSRLQAVAAALASGESGAYVPALREFCTEVGFTMFSASSSLATIVFIERETVLPPFHPCKSVAPHHI